MKDTTEVFIFGGAIIFLLVVIAVSIFSIGQPPPEEPKAKEQDKGENKMLDGLDKLLNMANIPNGEKIEQPVSESISVGNESNVDIKHSHGNVIIQGWENNEVKLEGIKIVKARDAETATKYAEMMRIEITSDGDNINVRTIRPERDRLWQVNQITINYQLYVPKGMNVALKNRHGNLEISQMDKDVVINHEHGNVGISNMEGKVSVKKQHGNMGVQSVNGGLELNHEHGNLSLTSIKNGLVMRKQHGDITGNDLEGNIKINNQHGKLHLHGIQGDLEIDKRHGRMDVGSVTGNISVQSGHSNLKIIDVEGDVYSRGSHGNVHVENVSGTADVKHSHSRTTFNNVGNVIEH